MINLDDIRNSAIADNGKYTICELETWYNRLLESTKVEINQVDLDGLANWTSTQQGQIKHDSGKFFSVVGYQIRAQGVNGDKTWHQPAINQNEIGILGFLCCKIEGILHFLVQAKIEPGNINFLQLSPTVQATRSNFNKVHGGKSVKFLSYFLNNIGVIDRLQSEQGGRFFRKLNRNVIVYMPDQLAEPENFRWMTLSQIGSFLKKDNKVNMDTRTVLSLLSSVSKEITGWHQELNFLSNQRFRTHTEIKPISLADVSEWLWHEGEFKRYDDNYFKIIGASVSIEGREVSRWDQPMIKPSSIGICGLIIRENDKKTQVLIQSKFEFGLTNKVEFSPTVQSLTGGRQIAVNNSIPFIEYFTSGKSDVRVIYKGMQSEEGGRFFQEANQNLIIKINGTLNDDIEGFRWIDLEILFGLISIGGIANIQLRNLVLILWLHELRK